MPPDLDAEIGKLAHCRLVALDDIKKLAEENNRRKQHAFVDAEEILAEELEKLCNALAFHRFTQKDAHWKNGTRTARQKSSFICCGTSWTAIPSWRF